MSDRYIEKSLLAFVGCSLLIHLVVAFLVLYLPAQQPPPPKEPVFIDLQQVPELKAEAPRQQQTPRLSDRRMRAEHEMAPRGIDARDSMPAQASRPIPRSRPPQPQIQPQTQPQVVQPAPGEMATPGRPSLPLPSRAPDQVPPGSSASSLLKPRQQQTAQNRSKPQLFPAASKMAKLEENYRRKFEGEIAEGDTKFLNTDDIQFGSFLRRFENAVYGVWRYPQEAARNGIEGITPVKITFNRRGEIMHVQLLESSGAVVLDDEVLRTLKQIGPVGSFPRGYDKDEFHLLAFFQYGLSRKSLR